MNVVVEPRLEPPSVIAERRARRRQSQIRSVLLHVHEDRGFDVRLEGAIALARLTSAHLSVVQTVPVDAYTTSDLFSSYISPRIVAELGERTAAIRARIDAELRRSGVSWSIEVTGAPLVRALVQRASLADLTIVGRRPQDEGLGQTSIGILGSLVCSTRNLVCIADDIRPLDLFARADHRLGWKCSRCDDDPEGDRAHSNGRESECCTRRAR